MLYTIPRFVNKPVDDGINDDLDGVGICEKVDDLHGMLDDAHCQKFLAVVAPVHHQ